MSGDGGPHGMGDKRLETITTATEAISGASVSFDPGTLAVKIEEMPSTKTDLNVRLGAFAEAPPCLDTEGSGALADQAEAEDERSRLERFRRELMDSQLYYHERVVKAFHTSLKVNDLAPLTVLSGLRRNGQEPASTRVRPLVRDPLPSRARRAGMGQPGGPARILRLRGREVPADGSGSGTRRGSTHNSPIGADSSKTPAITRGAAGCS